MAQALKQVKNKSRLKLFSLSTGMDLPFLILLMLILVVGLVCLYSAGYAYAYYYYDGDSYYFIKRQVLFALLGLGVMLAVSFVDYRALTRIWWSPWAFWGMTFTLLVVVLFIPNSSGISRWIRIPGIGQFQPSELAKFAVVWLFAHMAAGNQKQTRTFFKGFVPMLAILGVTCLLIAAEPHLSGTILVLAVGLVMMYIGGVRWPYLAGVVAIGVVGFFFMVFVLGYEKERIDVFLDPIGIYTSGQAGRDAAWQSVQSLYAIGSGGLLGTGLGNSRQKHLFLPEPQNDFIFSVVCEELGFVGAVLILLLFALLLWRGFVIATKARDKFGALLVIGIIAQVGLQVVFNVAVVSGAFPNTGISLPFFSYGGTSLVVLLAEMGLVLAVSRQTSAVSH